MRLISALTESELPRLLLLKKMEVEEYCWRQSQTHRESEREGEREMKGEKQKLWLEQYVEFFNYKSSEFLTKDQLNEIASINGFAKSHSRKLHIAELLGSIELTPPGRSTVGKCPVRSSSTEGISLAEAVKDIASIGWQECPIGSVLAVGGSAAATIEVEVVEEAAPFSFPSGSKDSKKTKSKRKRKTVSAIFSQPLIGTAE